MNQHIRQKMNGYLLPVPPGDSAITSLISGPGEYIFGATSGKEHSYLFVFDNILGRHITILANLGQSVAIFKSLVSDGKANIYFGTMPFVENDRMSLPQEYGGGHLYRFSITTKGQGIEEGINPPLLALSSPGVIDCGVAVKGEGIQNLLYSSKDNRIYGLTYPGFRLFYYDIATSSFNDVGSIFSNAVPLYFQNIVRPRLLMSDSDGNIYGTGENGYFFKYDAIANKISYIPVQVPGMQVRREMDSVESFCPISDEIIIGGTTDGYLFKYFPKEERIVNLGKPSMERRIRGIVRGHNGLLYGVAGDLRGAAHIFSYDLQERDYNDLGMLVYIPVEHNSPWTAYNIETMTMDRFGVIYLGEGDVDSHLFTFFP